MMKTVGVRELKDRLSEYLRRVRAGEGVLVTDRGEVIAELAPPGKTGEYMGMFSSSISLSYIVGPWLGVFLLDRLGAAATWGAMFVFGMSAAVLFVVSSRATCARAAPR